MSHQTFEVSRNPYTSHVFLQLFCHCDWFSGLHENKFKLIWVFLSNIRTLRCGTTNLKAALAVVTKKLVLSNVGSIKRRIWILNIECLILNSILEMKQELVWETNGWVLWGLLNDDTHEVHVGLSCNWIWEKEWK